jgi:probable rRNA maturation factor
MARHIDEQNNISFYRMTNGTLPKMPFVAIKNAILGKKYQLSVVFPDQQTSRELHRTWKNKTRPVNVLSFPLDRLSGEIFLTLSEARKEAKKYDRSYYEHLTVLFIHGILHLRGLRHGKDMDLLEKKFLKKFLK